MPFLFLWTTAVQGITDGSLSDTALSKVDFEQRLGHSVSRDLVFCDETGQPVRLGDFLKKTPVILVLGYYKCPMLCSMVLNGLVQSLGECKASAGSDFQVIAVSIDPSETPSLAREKKRNYLKRYGRGGSEEGWHFLTGRQAEIEKLAKEVGFAYAFDPASKQYAHPAGFVLLTPEGGISRYFFGVSFRPGDVDSAIERASAGRISSRIRELALLCFHYSPIKGKYGPFILTVLKTAGLLTVVTLAGMILFLARSARARSPSTGVVAAGPGSDAPPR